MNEFGILNIDRAAYVKAMAENLPTLRATLNLSQTELAECIGVTRQTISSIENGSRPLSWSNFLSLLFLFSKNEQTMKLMPVLGIYTEELDQVFSFTNLGKLKK